MKKSYIWIIVIAVVIVLLVIFRPKSDIKGTSTKSATKTNTVNGLIVRSSVTANSISVSGVILSNEEVTLQSQIAGLVTKVYFTEGSHVKKGELLVKIDDSQFQAQLQKDDVAKQLDQITVDRLKKLLDINGVSQQDYDVALNNLNSVIADMKLIQVSINYTNIVAPFEGIIGLKNISEGGYVAPSTVIADIEQVTPIKVDFYVPEKYISEVQKDETIQFNVNGYKDNFSGKIYAIDPKLDMTTGSIHVRAISENKDGRLLPGQFANISIQLSEDVSSLMIPSEAVVAKVIGQSIFIYKNGKIASVPVTLGLRTDSTVEVTKGLNIGDTIITEGTQFINPGSKVTFKEVR